MAEADSLRMVAEVVDKFSSPLRNLRSSLQSMSKDGAGHTKVLSDGLGKMEGAAKSAAQTVGSTLTPALATIGITSLSAAAAMAGIGAAIRNFTTNAAGLGQLSRDSGIAAERLRDLQSVMSKAGIDATASATAIQNFAEKLRVARTGQGELMEFLRTQGTTAEGRKYFNDLADSIMRSKDTSEALTKALEGMEGIQDPVGRRRYAEQVIGLGDAARLAEKHRGTIAEQLGKANKEMGPLDPATVKSAEDYQRALSGLSSTMKRIGTVIATELEGPLARVATTVKSFLDDERKGVTPAIVQTIRDAVAYIESVDWSGAFARLREGFGDVKTELGGAFKQLRELMAEFSTKGSGDAVSGVFKEIGAAANDTARAIRAVALSIGVLKDLKNFDFAEAGKKLAEIDRSTDAGIGKRSNAEPTKKLTPEAEALLGTITGGKPEDAVKSQREAEAQRREQGKLTDELRRLREALPDKKPGEAAVDKMSAVGEGAFPGALIQRASFGAHGAMAGVGRGLATVGRERQQVWGDGGNGTPGGIDLPADLPRRPAGRPGDPRGVPAPQSGPFPGRNFGGGRFNVLSGVPPLAPAPGGSGERVGRSLRGEAPAAPDTGGRASRGATSAEGQQNVKSWQEFFKRPKDQGGMGLEQDKADAMVAMMQGESGPNLNSRAYNPNDNGGPSGGTAQWHDKFGQGGRLTNLKRFAEDRGTDWTDRETQQQFWKREAETTHRRAFQAIEGAETGEEALRQGIDKFENPADKPGEFRKRMENLRRLRRNRAPEIAEDSSSTFPNGAPKVLKPKSMTDAPGSVMGEGRADGEGFAARQRAMNAYQDKDRARGVLADGGRSVLEKALRSKAMGNGAQGDVSGNVSVFVAKPGPDTKVSTSASGNLFRDVKMRRGNPVNPAADD